MSALYLAQTLAEDETLAVLSSNVFIILPLLNPDSWTNQEPNEGIMSGKSVAATCSGNANFDGVDLTRNFDGFWDVYMASDDQAQKAEHEDGCSAVYHGSKPFSEPETTAVLSVLDEYSPKCKMAQAQPLRFHVMTRH